MTGKDPLFTPNEERVMRLRDHIWELKDLADQVSGNAQASIARAVIELTRALKELETIDRSSKNA